MSNPEETSDRKVAISYLRVSTARQLSTGSDIEADGNSIATQRQANQAKAASLGAIIQEEFVEPGASAQTITKRPAFRRLLHYVSEHPEIDYVIIYMRSRAFRNLGDAVITKRQLEGLGVRLVSAKEDFGEGIMADAMEAVTDIINEVQVRMSGEDIKVKMLHKAELGGTNGRAKLGYRNVRIEYDGRLVNTIEPDRTRATLVHRAFELYATGDLTIEAVREAVTDLGLTTRATRSRPAQPVSISKLHRMLRDDYYLGMVRYKGVVYRGRHEAIIEQNLFDRVQDVMDRRSKRGTRDRVIHHYLKGMLFCGRCDAAGRVNRVIYTEATGKTGQRYGYFLCRGRQDGVCELPYLPAADVEWAVTCHYDAVQLPAHTVTTIREGIREALEESQQSVHDLHDGFRDQLQQLNAKEARLLDLAADGTIDSPALRERLNQLVVDRRRLEQKLGETVDDLVSGAEVVEAYIDLLVEPHRLYAGAPNAARHDLNYALFERIYVDDSGVRRDVKVEAVAELHRLGDDPEPLAAVRSLSNNSTPAKDRGTGGDLTVELVEPRGGSSKDRLVRRRGLEPPRSQ